MTDTPDLVGVEAGAERLADLVLTSATVHSRLYNTERMWYYRSYQGGEPYNIIDWRQSARVDELFVREHEPIFQRKIHLSLDFEAIDPSLIAQAEILFLALGQLLVRSGRRVCFLGVGSAGHTSVRGLQAAWAETHSPPPLEWLQSGKLIERRGCAIILSDFTDRASLWVDCVKGLAARNYHGLLIQVGPTLSDVSPLSILLKNLDWPMFSRTPTTADETLLPQLYENALHLSL